MSARARVVSGALLGCAASLLLAAAPAPAPMPHYPAATVSRFRGHARNERARHGCLDCRRADLRGRRSRSRERASERRVGAYGRVHHAHGARWRDVARRDRGGGRIHRLYGRRAIGALLSRRAHARSRSARFVIRARASTRRISRPPRSLRPETRSRCASPPCKTMPSSWASRCSGARTILAMPVLPRSVRPLRSRRSGVRTSRRSIVRPISALPLRQAPSAPRRPDSARRFARSPIVYPTIRSSRRARQTRSIPASPPRIIARRDVGAPWVVVGFAAPAPDSRDFGAMLVLESLLSDAFERRSTTTLGSIEKSIGATYLYDTSPASLVVYVNGALVDPSMALRELLVVSHSLSQKPIGAQTARTFQGRGRGSFP